MNNRGVCNATYRSDTLHDGPFFGCDNSDLHALVMLCCQRSARHVDQPNAPWCTFCSDSLLIISAISSCATCQEGTHNCGRIGTHAVPSHRIHPPVHFNNNAQRTYHDRCSFINETRLLCTLFYPLATIIPKQNHNGAPPRAPHCCTTLLHHTQCTHSPSRTTLLSPTNSYKSSQMRASRYVLPTRAHQRCTLQAPSSRAPSNPSSACMKTWQPALLMDGHE